MTSIIIAAIVIILALLPWAAKFSGQSHLLAAANFLAASFRKITKVSFGIGAAASLFIILTQISSLVIRNVFGVNFIWLQESALYMFGAMFLFSAAYIFLIDGHVRVDIMYSHWSRARKRIADLLGIYLFLFPVCILILTAAAPYVVQSWKILEGSPEPSGVPAVFLLKSMIPAFGALVAMAGFIKANELLNHAPPDDAQKEAAL